MARRETGAILDPNKSNLNMKFPYICHLKVQININPTCTVNTWPGNHNQIAHSLTFLNTFDKFKHRTIVAKRINGQLVMSLTGIV